MKEYNKKYYLAHKEAKKKYGRKHYQENKEAQKAYRKEYRLAHKETKREYHREYSREYYKKIKLERPWVTHFKNAKRRCNNPDQRAYKYYRGKGIKFKLTMGEVKALYLMDNAKNMKIPSIDRIYNDGNYTFGNCRFIELSENIRRSHVKRSMQT